MESSIHGMEKDGRKRKSHTKSRKGCGNCKLRRVKCDESHPQCQKCVSYGVTCNYETLSDELQLPGEGAFTFSTTPRSAGPGDGPDVPKDSMSPEADIENKKIDALLGISLKLHDTDECYELTKEDLDTLRSFRERTVFTVGTAQSVHAYRNEVLNLAAQASYLMHIVLTLTLMHERLTLTPNSWFTSPGEKESFHWYHGTAIFNRMLSQPIKEEDCDPLWGTAALLGAVTIASIEATTPEDAWPLKPMTSDDLDWLRMSDGKKEIWRLVNPLRPTSIWRDVMNHDKQKDPEPYDHPVPELDMLYPFLTKIYDYDPLSPEGEGSDDPYHTAAAILVRLLQLDCNHSTIMYFLSFLGHMDSRYRVLLHEKDPKALLLLAWWYGKMCSYSCWWQERRMVLEGQSICLYLERNHADKEDIMKMLYYPKMMTGLIAPS